MDPQNQQTKHSSSMEHDLNCSGSTLRSIFNETLKPDQVESNDLRRSSPLHWATLSDTILVSPVGLPVLKVIVCSGTESGSNTPQQHSQTVFTNKLQPIRSKSVSNLNEEKLKHSDEDVIQMRNKLLILAKNRALFLQLERNQKWALALICIVYFFCFCAISVLAPFFHQMAVLHNISTSTYGTEITVFLVCTFCQQ